MSTILTYFPGGAPRPAQERVLKDVERVWNSSDVIVIEAPTGCGKSHIAYTIARWAYAQFKQESSILTPTNILVDQYTRLFPRLHVLKAKHFYTCSDRTKSSCAEHHRVMERHCEGCPYVKAVRRAHAMPYGIYNPYTYLAHRLFKSVVIVDEAHNLLNIIKDLSAKRLWKHSYNFPSWVTSYRTLLRWTTEQLALRPKDEKLLALKADLENGTKRYLVERALEFYRNREEEVLKLIPLDLTNERDYFWPAHTKRKVTKVVLLSATLSQIDIEQLNLTKRRVIWLRAESAIPKERRPVVYKGLDYLKAGHPPSKKVFDFIASLMYKHTTTKGILHMPYAYASLLKQAVPDELRARLIFHDKDNKDEVFNHWRSSPPGEGKVLVASGMYEGIDLKGDDFRWQIVLKVPFPNLGEPSYAYLAEHNPEHYAWLAIKDILQASGRICRSPDDYGETFIIDKNFDRLLSRYKHLFPMWFIEALTYDKT